MNKLAVATIAIMALLLIFAACTAGTAPTSGSPPAATASPARGAAAPTAWDELVAAAKKEGTLTGYGNLPPTVRDAITPPFKAKYGINIEWAPGRPTELIAKIKAERNAGLHLVDVGFFGGGPFTTDIKPMGVSQPLEPLLLLPEVKDPKNWRGGQLPFHDKTGMAFMLVLMANSFYQRNTDLVKESEITSSMDLLNPKWKEKLILSDPSISGAPNTWFAWMLSGVLGQDKGLQFMKDLVQQKPAITRDERQMIESLAKGKYHVAIASTMSLPAEFMQMGAPIAFIEVKEPRSLSPGGGVINVFKDAPHPNAARLFLNWVLSKEGGALFAPAMQYPSLRLDVPPERILPIMVPRPDDVYPEGKFGDEDFSLLKGEMRKVAADVFKSLSR